MTFHRFLAFVAFVSVIGRRSWIIFVDLDSMRQAAVDDLVVNTLWWETDVATTSATILPVPTLHCIQRTVHFIVYFTLWYYKCQTETLPIHLVHHVNLLRQWTR
jgi:hypothetical protein